MLIQWMMTQTQFLSNLVNIMSQYLPPISWTKDNTGRSLIGSNIHTSSPPIGPRVLESVSEGRTKYQQFFLNLKNVFSLHILELVRWRGIKKYFCVARKHLSAQ